MRFLTDTEFVLLEKQSYFNYAFALPRNSVFFRRESNAFLPFDYIADGATEGIFQRIPYTSQRPQSDLLATFSPKRIASTGDILVKPTLRVGSIVRAS
ncbi:Pyr-redox-2 domain-containing protein [Fusarium keratoplasticum]|nr:Pyr-redox-2 domain-containing protein [Fusarium keratoplasticum]